MDEDSLYRRILGPDFDRLPPVLKDFHSGPRQADGEFTVEVVPGSLKSFARWLFRLPKVSSTCQGTLDTEWTPPGEVWTRDVGTWRFVTRQWESDGLLFENHRKLKMAFRVDATSDGMSFRQVHVTWFKLRLPKFLSPTIQADVLGQENGWTVTVAIRAPFVGELVRYKGSLVAL